MSERMSAEEREQRSVEQASKWTVRANEQADERMAQYLTHPLHTFSTQSTFVGPSIRRTKFFRIFENAGFQPHRWIGTEHKYIMQQDHDTLCVCVCACARVRICVCVCLSARVFVWAS